MSYKLVVYIPEEQLERVKSALFDAGAGVQGNYDQCCWQTLGQGQFRPLQSSNPYIGEVGQLETLPEWCVEMLVDADKIAAVKAALLEAHPYEQPAFEFLLVADS